MDSQVIFNPADSKFKTPNRQFQGIPAIAETSDGALWAAWYSGTLGEGAGNFVILVKSEDKGKSWSEPLLAIDPPGEKSRAYDPCLWVDPKERLWLFWARSENGWYDGRAGVWSMRLDKPENASSKWSEPVRHCDGVMMNKPTITSKGEWLFPVGHWKLGDSPLELAFSKAYVSDGDGEAWTLRGQADVPDRSFDEHMIVERKDASLWMLVRTKYGIGESFSFDDGRTWTPGQDSKLGGPCSRFFIRRLKSGRLILVNHKSKKRDNLTAWLSEDDGKTWKGELLLDEREGVSYPDGVECADGKIRVIYDFNRGDNYSLGKDKEILMAVFEESEVLAGKLSKPGSKLKQIVNKAG